MEKSKRTHDPEDLDWEDYNDTIEDGIDLTKVINSNQDDDKIDAEVINESYLTKRMASLMLSLYMSTQVRIREIQSKPL